MTPLATQSRLLAGLTAGMYEKMKFFHVPEFRHI